MAPGRVIVPEVGEIVAPLRKITVDAWMTEQIDGECTLVGRPEPAPARVIDFDGLAEAVRMLELTFPVEIRYTRGYRTAGSYCGLGWKREGWHVIDVGTPFTAERMSRTLWHELTHAHQTETFVFDRDTDADVDHLAFKRFLKAYRVFSATSGGSARYARNPYERAARANEDYAEACPLFTTC